MSDVPNRTGIRIEILNWRFFWCVVIFFALVCSGLIVPIVQFGWILATGWISFLWRPGHESTVPYGSVGWFAFCLFLLIFLGHNTIRWILSRGHLTESVDEIHRPARSWPFRLTCVVSVTALCSVIAGICLVGITHEMIWIATSKNPITEMDSGRRAARRTQSKNNLKQLGLSFHLIHDQSQGFPTSMTFDEHGKIRHGWEVAVLPEIDRLQLYEQIRFDLPWYAPENKGPFSQRLLVFLNPAIAYDFDEDGYALIHYAGNNQVLLPDRKLRFKDFTDGSSNTIFAGEINSEFPPWGKPGNCRDPAIGINKSPQGFGSPFKGGAQFLMGDGTVRFISENVDPKTLKALATPNGDDPVGEF